MDRGEAMLIDRKSAHGEWQLSTFVAVAVRACRALPRESPRDSAAGEAFSTSGLRYASSAWPQSRRQRKRGVKRSPSAQSARGEVNTHEVRSSECWESGKLGRNQGRGEVAGLHLPRAELTLQQALLPPGLQISGSGKPSLD